MDVIADFFRQPTARRGLLIALFAATLMLFQKLLPMLAAYAVFTGVFLTGAQQVRKRTGWTEQRSIGLVLVLLTLLLVGTLFGAWYQLAASWQWFHIHWQGLNEVKRMIGGNATLTGVLELFGGIQALKERVSDADTLSHLGSGAASAFSSGKTMLVEVLMAFFLALLHALDRERIRTMVDGMDALSVPRTLLRWWGFVADAFALTVQLQLVVALCNTAIILPVLLLMGVPHVGAVMAFTFVAGLVPVVGNYASAVVLSALAWTAKGWIAAPVFLALAVLLGKLESFYLTPRLASQHVNVPAFILTLSLVVFEIQLGFIGLFLSFPFLYVFLKIREDLQTFVPTSTPAPTDTTSRDEA